MKTILFTILFSMWFASGKVPKQINWKKLATESQVHQALSARIPVHGSPAEVKDILALEKHAFLQQYGDSLITFISPEVHASLLLSRKWLLRFHFQNNTLSAFTAREALTGP